MKCKNIVLMAFYHGDNDKELTDNINALLKKQKGCKKNGDFIKMIVVHVPKGCEKDALSLLEKEGGAALSGCADNGLYLILHAGATRSNPDAAVLADIIATAYLKNMRFRKINLAGCFTSGNKNGNVISSVMASFTKRLTELMVANKEEDRLDGTAVCGYLSEVTTFDEDSEHYNTLVNHKGYKPPVGITGGVHNLVQISKDKTLHATHPAIKPEDVKALQTINQQYEKIYKGGPYGKAKTPLDQEKAFLAQKGVIDKKAEPLDDRMAGLVGHYNTYIRNKLVVAYDKTAKKFVPTSLAAYTDNADSRDMILEVEKTHGQQKFMFTL